MFSRSKTETSFLPSTDICSASASTGRSPRRKCDRTSRNDPDALCCHQSPAERGGLAGAAMIMTKLEDPRQTQEHLAQSFGTFARMFAGVFELACCETGEQKIELAMVKMSNLAIRDSEFEPRQSPQGLSQRWRRVRCLVMDDNLFDRRRLQRLSVHSRYHLEFIEAVSVSQARAHLLGDRIDVALLDFRMPDGDGIALTAEIISGHSKTAPAIIVMSGNEDTDTPDRALRSGAAAFLSKDRLTGETLDRALTLALAEARRSVPRANKTGRHAGRVYPEPVMVRH